MHDIEANALERRARLPEELRFLLGDYPRRIWGEHPNFGPTTRLYLDRHAMFRECLHVMRRLAAEGLDVHAPPTDLGPQFGRVGSFFLHELTLHHMIEDQRYFPALARLEPRLERGFEILDRDHHAIHDALERFESVANASLKVLAAGTPESRRSLADLETELGRLARILDRHLEDEDEVVIPLMLDRGEAALGLD